MDTALAAGGNGNGGGGGGAKGGGGADKGGSIIIRHALYVVGYRPRKLATHVVCMCA